MKRRPTSISVICWIMIAYGGVITTAFLIIKALTPANAVPAAATGRTVLPPAIENGMMAAHIILLLVCGLAMLRGHSWGRTTWVAWNIAGFVVGLGTTRVTLHIVPGFLIFLIVAFFLYRPAAREYFSGDGGPVKPMEWQ